MYLVIHLQCHWWRVWEVVTFIHYHVLLSWTSYGHFISLNPVLKDQPYNITDKVSSCLMHITLLIMKSLPITLVEAFLSDLKWPHWLVRVIFLCLKRQTSCFQCLFLCSSLLCGNDDFALSIRKCAYTWSHCRLSNLFTCWLSFSVDTGKKIMICRKPSSVSGNWPLF